MFSDDMLWLGFGVSMPKVCTCNVYLCVPTYHFIPQNLIFQNILFLIDLP
jgi:hypothetical protein